MVFLNSFVTMLIDIKLINKKDDDRKESDKRTASPKSGVV